MSVRASFTRKRSFLKTKRKGNAPIRVLENVIVFRSDSYPRRYDVVVGDGGVFFRVEGLLVQVPCVLGVVRRVRDVDVVRSINKYLARAFLDAGEMAARRQRVSARMEWQGESRREREAVV